MGEEDLADSVLLNLDHIDLARFEVVGNYVRYDEKTRHALKDFRRKVMAGGGRAPRSPGEYPNWGAPGSGERIALSKGPPCPGPPAGVGANPSASHATAVAAPLGTLAGPP